MQTKFKRRQTKKRKLLKRKRQTKKNRNRKGGKTNQVGTTATIYYNPRPLCENEELTNKMYNEVGKVGQIRNGRQMADIEISKLKVLQDHGVNLEEVQKYLVIPMKVCKISENNFNGQEPFGSEYFKSQRFTYGAKTPFQKLQQAKNDGAQMVTYNLLDRNLLECINDSNNLEDTLEILLKLKNVYEGLDYLKNFNLAHNELHIQNIMLGFDGFMKMIDIGTLGPYENINDYKELLYLLYFGLFKNFMSNKSKFKFDERLVPIKYFFIFSNLFYINLCDTASDLRLVYKTFASEELRDLILDAFHKLELLQQGQLQNDVRGKDEYKIYKRTIKNENVENKFYFGDDFQGENLHNKKFKNVSFHSCNLDSVDFSRSDFYCVDFSHASLIGADFRGVNIKNYVCFFKANLDKANFSGSKLVGVDFSYASLVGADFRGVEFKYLGSTKFLDADLRDCIFDEDMLDSEYELLTLLRTAKNFVYIEKNYDDDKM